MKKKGIFIGVSVLVVLGLLFGSFGCRQAPEVAPPEEEVYTFVYHCPWPPGQILSDIEGWYLDQVEARSEGRIIFNRVYGGTLGTLFAQAENLTKRVFDIGQVSYVYQPGLYPLGTVTTLPGIEDNSVVWGRACHELSVTEPAMEAEYAALNQKYLFTWALEPMEIASHVPIYTLEDFEGLRIRVHGGSALAFEKLGYTGVTVPWEELPVAAAEHVVDAGCFPVPITGRDIGLHTIFKYYITPFPVYQFHFATAMNLEAWNELPPDLQAVMLDVADDAVEYTFTYLDAAIAQGYQDLEDAGVIWIDWPAEEMARFRELAGEPVWEDWVVEKTAEGLPAQEILDAFQAILEKHR
jgi:TRAP-type C4-dicarboxylate transport system substrate-binding protein